MHSGITLENHCSLLKAADNLSVTYTAILEAHRAQLTDFIVERTMNLLEPGDYTVKE